MELLLCQIIRHVQEGMPELSVVDENYGQLENLSQPDTDMYPLTFPAVLIDLQEATWSNTADNCQKGTVRVCVQLLIDCYDGLHATSGTMETVRQRAAVAERLHALLQGYRPMQDGRLVRANPEHGTKPCPKTQKAPPYTQKAPPQPSVGELKNCAKLFLL